VRKREKDKHGEGGGTEKLVRRTIAGKKGKEERMKEGGEDRKKERKVGER